MSARRWEHRSALIRQSIKQCARDGRPNPLLAAVWRDDKYAASVICSNPNNFDLGQVQEARLLASLDWSPEQIASRLACSPARIMRLLKGSTYSRVH